MSKVEEFSCDNCDGEGRCTKECECNECEADRIRKNAGVSDDPASPDKEPNFPSEKYKDYGMFDGNFNKLNKE